MIVLERFKVNVLLIQTIQELEHYFKKLSTEKPLTFDWETEGLSYDALPLGIALHQRNKDAAFVPIDCYFKEGLPLKEVAEVLNREFPRFKLIAHNSKFDTMVNKGVGVLDENVNLLADTMIMIHCTDSDLLKKLEVRVKEDFGYSKKSFEEIIGKKWAKVNWNREGDELLQQLAGYAGEDVYWETQLYYEYKDRMDEDAWRVHDKIELPLVKILRDAKIKGIKIDVDKMNAMAEEACRRMEELREAVYEAAGCVFNLNSSKQKAEVFFDKLKLPCLKKTKGGGRSTDADTMESLAEMGFPIAELMVGYSELNKLYSGYLVAIPNQVDAENVLRGDLNAQGTTTGRFSSSGPNLQNQPNNDDLPVRSAFIPREGHVFINYDFSQIELRVMAQMSKDKTFLEVFRNDEDPHTDVAKRLRITRKGAKVVNFGVLYGMGPQKLAKVLDVSEEKAAKIINEDYMRTYSGFASWKTQVEQFARNNGYVKSYFGRIRRLPDVHLKDTDRKRYFAALRQAVNTKIQGTAADLMKLCIIEVERRFREKGMKSMMLLTVHDEELVEAPFSEMIEAEAIMVDVMENHIKFDIPIKADGKIVLNWAEMKSPVVSYPYRYDFTLYDLLLN